MYCESLSEHKPPYTPGRERWNMYRSVWIRHWPEFNGIYPHRYEAMYGMLDDEKRGIRNGYFKPYRRVAKPP